MSTEFVMYDSVDVAEIPADAVAVAGYVGGRWPTYEKLAARFPHARRLSIAVSSAEDAECLDVERGDAEPGDAAAWVERQLARGLRRPVVYSSVSVAPAVLAALKRAGIERRAVRVWTAHYTGKPHRCTAACDRAFTRVADATQYDDRALGRNLDASLCAARFLG
jgi:hypothetical protein